MLSIRNLLIKILTVLAIVLCGFMVILVAYQVFTRFVLNNPSAVSEELASIMFVWMALCASALLYAEKGHMNISFTYEKLGPYRANYLIILSEICTCIMAIWVLSYGGYIISSNGMAQINASMPFIKIGVNYAIIPATGVCVAYFALCNIVEAVQKLKAGKNAKL